MTVSICEVPDLTENLPPGRRLTVSVKLYAEPRLSNSICPPRTIRHTHPGIETGYVLEGEFDLPIQGQPTHRLKPGDAYQVAESLHGILLSLEARPRKTRGLRQTRNPRGRAFWRSDAGTR